MAKTELPKAAHVIITVVGTAIGAVLILLSLWRFALYFTGANAQAEITELSTAYKRGVYTHTVRYEFEADGKQYHGNTRVSDDKSDISGISAKVYFMPFAPALNALEYDAQISFGQFVYIVLGTALIIVMNKKPKKAG